MGSWANDFGAFSGKRNAAGGIQDARFETSKNRFSLRFYEKVFQDYCEGSSSSHRGPSQPNYSEGPDLRTLMGSTLMRAAAFVSSSIDLFFFFQ